MRGCVGFVGRVCWALASLGSVGCNDSSTASAVTGTDGGSVSSGGFGPTLTSTTSEGSGGSNTGGSSTGGSSTGGSSTGGSSTGGSDTGSATSGAGSIGGQAGADTSGETTGAATTGSTGETVAGDTCSFSVSHSASSAIGTVEIVTWSTDLENLSDAHIDFGLAGAELDMTAPVDLAEPGYRTVLVGMKGDTSYAFRLVASSETSSETKTCTSPEISFTTGTVPDWVPTITKGGSGVNAAKGFIVTTSGLNLFGVDQHLPSVYIFDTDGDVVWWTENEIDNISGARMSWDAKTMWSLSAYSYIVFSVSMDGMTAREYPELDGANHDLTVLPDGGVATMINNGFEEPYSFVELKADGTLVTIVPDLAAVLDAPTMHPNAVHYYPEDNTFTLSELSSSAIVKFTRTGELVWQIGGDAPLGDSFELVGLEPWRGNHGHHLTADGHFLFFNNFHDEAEDPAPRIFEVLLDDEDWTATKTWEYSVEGSYSDQLGDVQRLPNGNVLITYSNMAQIIEVAPSGEVVQSFDNDMFRREGDTFPYAVFGYASFRTSLYGPPPR